MSRENEKKDEIFFDGWTSSRLVHPITDSPERKKRSGVVPDSPEDKAIYIPNGKYIFVFGSNLKGFHGAGAALTALKDHGAILGQGIGLQGRSYAIPTKDTRLKALPLEHIRNHVSDFLKFARLRPEYIFLVTRIGTGYAGYTDAQISPMFDGCNGNVMLPKAWGGEGFDW